MTWYKDGYFWRKPSPQWEIDNYGEAVNGKGDIITNTMKKIIRDNDTSHWAKIAVSECIYLFWEDKRWPDEMNQDCDANNWVRWKWSQLLHKFKIRKTVMFRPQNYLTRDPFICWITACVILDRKEWMEKVKIPWHLYRPHIWKWRRRLIKDNSRDYVKALRYYMDLASVKNYKS